jgi:hypothetical protein
MNNPLAPYPTNQVIFMGKTIFTRLLFFLFGLGLLATMPGCEKFKGDQEVPAYISIDAINLKVDPGQGSASSNITDAWVYVDDVQVGTFQLPATFPVLAQGNKKITIYAGVKENGVAATRVAYPFYEPIEIQRDLVELDTLALGILTVDYSTTTQFYLIESFEGVTQLFDTTKSSEVPLELTPLGDTLTFEGNHSGMVVMDSALLFFECINDRDFVIPYAPVYLELNFRTNNVFVAGVYMYGLTTIYQVPIVYMNPTNNQWKKIYINLTNTLNGYTGYQLFRVYFAAIQSTAVDTALILMDNIKVVTR